MTRRTYGPKYFNGKLYRFASAHGSRERAADVARLRRKDGQLVRLVDYTTGKGGTITAIYFRGGK